MDGELYPNRVIVAARRILRPSTPVGRRVRRHPHVIGDFTWTGWDYLGEAGIGRTVYAQPGAGRGTCRRSRASIPWRTAWCGDIDITGHRRPQSYYREIVFGLRTDPYLAVRATGASRRGCRRHPVVLERRRVELELGRARGRAGDRGGLRRRRRGRTVGERPLRGPQPSGRGAPLPGRRSRPTYEPGRSRPWPGATAPSVGRTSLRSATGPGAARRDGRPRGHRGRPPRPGLRDPQPGRRTTACLHVARDRRVEVQVDGPGVLQALGSANPRERRGVSPARRCTTFDGRALAVVRPTGEGRITADAPRRRGASHSRSRSMPGA